MMLVAFPLLWWNEGRAVRTAQGLTEGASAVVSVAADSVDASRDGALVHVSGLATTTETPADEEFGVSAPALTLVRSVEMFQWREEKKSEKRKKLGGSEETTTTYTYKTGWSRTAIDSADFRQPDGHRNPGRLPWESKTIVAERVTLGAFTLPRDLVATIAAREPLQIDAGGAAQAAALGVKVANGGSTEARIRTTRLSATSASSTRSSSRRWSASSPCSAATASRRIRRRPARRS